MEVGLYWPSARLWWVWGHPERRKVGEQSASADAGRLGVDERRSMEDLYVDEQTHTHRLLVHVTWNINVKANLCRAINVKMHANNLTLNLL